MLPSFTWTPDVSNLTRSTDQSFFNPDEPFRQGGTRLVGDMGSQATDYVRAMMSDPDFLNSLKQYSSENAGGYTSLEDFNRQFLSYEDMIGSEGHRQAAYANAPSFYKLGDETVASSSYRPDPFAFMDSSPTTLGNRDGQFDPNLYYVGLDPNEDDITKSMRYDAIRDFSSVQDGQRVFRYNPETKQMEERGALSREVSPEDIAKAYASGAVYSNSDDYDFLHTGDLNDLIKGKYGNKNQTKAGIQQWYNSLTPEQQQQAFQFDEKGKPVGVRNEYLPQMLAMGAIQQFGDVNHGYKKKDDILGPLLAVASFIPGIAPFARVASGVYNTGQGIANGNLAQGLMGGLGLYNASVGLANNANFGNTNPAAMGSRVYSSFNPQQWIGQQLGLSGNTANLVGGAAMGGGLAGLTGGNVGMGAVQGAISGAMPSYLQSHGFSAPTSQMLTQTTRGLLSGRRPNPQQLALGGLRTLSNYMLPQG